MAKVELKLFATSHNWYVLVDGQCVGTIFRTHNGRYVAGNGGQECRTRSSAVSDALTIWISERLRAEEIETTRLHLVQGGEDEAVLPEGISRLPRIRD